VVIILDFFPIILGHVNMCSKGMFGSIEGRGGEVRDFNGREWRGGKGR
jgi:hypothetical protein